MIAAIYSQLKPPKRVSCIICQRKVELTQTTACLTTASHPVFACATHLGKAQERAWFRGWLNFMVRLQVATALAFVVRKLAVLA